MRPDLDLMLESDKGRNNRQGRDGRCNHETFARQVSDTLHHGCDIDLHLLDVTTGTFQFGAHLTHILAQAIRVSFQNCDPSFHAS